MKAALLALALLTAACTPGAIGGSGNNDPGRPGGPSGPGAGNPGGAANPGGGGNGSTPSPGTMGGAGPGSPPATPGDGGFQIPDAGASGDAPPTGGPGVPGCQVIITPLNPPRLDNLLAGATNRLRVQARVTGAEAPAMPTWEWQVQLGPIGDVPISKLSPEGDTVEFPLSGEGFYTIQAAAGPSCRSQVTARALRPVDRVTTYWARVTPPRDSNLPTHEARIMVGGQQPTTKTIVLSPGVPVMIEPKKPKASPTAIGETLRSYIRISSPVSSIRFEGNNLSQMFKADLESGRPYDVLIVPVGTEAPVLLSGRTANQLQAEQFIFDDGLAVTGTIQRTQAGTMQPVTDARVFLRSGNLPSSIGQTNTGGEFLVRARDGAFQVSVIPGAATGLPEARLPAGTSYTPAAPPAPLQLTYAALPTTDVQVAIRSSDGQRPVEGARVRLDAEPASLGDAGRVGTFQLPGNREVPAEGALRAEATSTALGSASFARLPLGRYRALVAPPAGMTDAATTVATIEVTAGMGPAMVTLVRPVKLTGRLLPAPLAQGLKLQAIETDGPNPGESLAATVDATGLWALSVAPGRTYRLQIEPDQARRLPRLFLGPHTAGMADSFHGEVMLAEGVPIFGELTNGKTAVGGAVIQIFCSGAPPDCMDEQAPQLDTARPLAETRADANGRFQVHLPDPARWDL